jgi:hypothetical protein
VGRTQLAINIPAPLLERLRAAAAERGVTYSSLVLQWIEAGLGAPRSDLAARLDALEQRLDALATSPVRGIPALPKPATPIPQVGDAPLLQPLPGGDGITTAELALKTGTNRGAWNNWAKPERVGQVRHHPQAGSWKLIGKAATAIGGPERWLWRLDAGSEQSV